ncbi:methyltransferase domain-containing protein [Mariprofundus micogutta]|nr:methyltransferase domain-containing protein [Mariprofundus micogutta]
MNIEESFFSISWFFSAWVRLMEYHTRKKEVLDSARLGPRRLIISPPTDAGIPLLVQANAQGTTELLCFSDRNERKARNYSKKKRMDALTTQVKPFFKIPAADNTVSVVYANCFFDFCVDVDFNSIIQEIWRVLEPGGVLFAVYMAPPSGYRERGWEWTFARFRFLSHGCHPVTIVPHLIQGGMQILKDIPAVKLGFPIRYTVSEKPVHVV